MAITIINAGKVGRPTKKNKLTNAQRARKSAEKRKEAGHVRKEFTLTPDELKEFEQVKASLGADSVHEVVTELCKLHLGIPTRKSIVDSHLSKKIDK